MAGNGLVLVHLARGDMAEYKKVLEPPRPASLAVLNAPCSYLPCLLFGVAPASARLLASRHCMPEQLSAPNASISPGKSSLRADGRRADQLRPIRFQNHIAPYATGSTLAEWGNTRVICGVTVEETVPRWMMEQNVTGGWITAEYSMLPYSTPQRKQREIAKGKIDGRSQEIQRLIGRAMRAAVDLEKLGARTIWVDCDVLQADGGTRTAAITGSYVALALAIEKLLAQGMLKESPLHKAVAAVSVGIVNQQALLDLCYVEDAAAEVDMNIVLTQTGEFIELQGSGEESTFSDGQLAVMLSLGRSGIEKLFLAQQEALAAGHDKV